MTSFHQRRRDGMLIPCRDSKGRPVDSCRLHGDSDIVAPDLATAYEILDSRTDGAVIGLDADSAERTKPTRLGRHGRGRIVVDIDGSIGDFVGAMAEWTNRNRGVSGLGEPSTYDFSHDPMWSRAYATGGDFGAALKSAVADGVYLREHPYAHAARTIRDLRADGYDVVVATDRGFGDGEVDARALRDTRRWLAGYGFDVDDIIITGDKEDIDGDVFVEDSPGNIERIRDAGAKVIRIRHDYNESTAADATVDDWDGFGEALQSLRE